MYLAAHYAQDKAGAYGMLFLYSLIMAVEDSGSVGNGKPEHVQELQGWALSGGKAAVLTQSEVSQPCRRQIFLGFQTMHVSPTRRSSAARERPCTGK